MEECYKRCQGIGINILYLQLKKKKEQTRDETNE
jgi:hypothetical protein